MAITITLHHSDLLYDIENTTFLVGLNRSTGDNFEQVSNIQNTGEGGDRDMMMRSIGDAFSEVKRNVNRFIDDSVTNSSANTLLTKGTFSVVLTMPGVFNQASVDSITSAMHDYIVAHALIDWFSAVLPTEVPLYAQKKADANTDLLSAIYRKTSPSRPTA